MSLGNTEEKEWLSTVIVGALDRAIYKLKPEDRPTWATWDRVREFLAQIASHVVNDQAWPGVVECCKRCRAAQNLVEELEYDHVLVDVEDVPAASNVLILVDSPVFVLHKIFASNLKETTGTSDKNTGELGEIQYRGIDPEKVGWHRFDIGPAVIKGLRERNKIERGRTATP
jgi:hypothetical protein